METTEQRTLIDFLSDVSFTFSTSACCVVQDDNASSTRILSYSAAWCCFKKHELWLEEALKNVADSDDYKDCVVAYLSTNSVDMLLSMLACTSARLQPSIAALLNIRWTASEMSRSLQSKAKDATTILLFGPGFESTAKLVVSQLGHRSSCFPLQRFSFSLLEQAIDFPRRNFGSQKPQPFGKSTADMIRYTQLVGSDRDAIIVFTSGTTGGSKGVRLSHRALAIQSLAKLEHPCNYCTETTMLASTVPLFHVGGLSSCLAVLLAGGSLIFPASTASSGFNPNCLRQSLVDPFVPTNTLVVVPAMLVSLFENHKAENVHPHVRLILIGGQSASESLIQKIIRIFPNAQIVQTYACTEAASSLTFLPVNSNIRVIRGKGQRPAGDCVGTSPSHVHIRLYRKAGRSMNILHVPYEVGIIATRGPHLMNGYWQRGISGQQSNLTGWFLTNDLGFFDENGQFYFCGRVKDVIRSGGETVLAQEVERVLLMHSEISECAVFPRKDERFGEAVACAIVLKPRQHLSLGEIKKWCEAKGLASYKRPRYLFLVDSIPRNSSGKVLKHELVKTFGRLRSKL